MRLPPAADGWSAVALILAANRLGAGCLPVAIYIQLSQPQQRPQAAKRADAILRQPQPLQRPTALQPLDCGDALRGPCGRPCTVCAACMAGSVVHPARRLLVVGSNGLPPRMSQHHAVSMCCTRIIARQLPCAAHNLIDVSMHEPRLVDEFEGGERREHAQRQHLRGWGREDADTPQLAAARHGNAAPSRTQGNGGKKQPPCSTMQALHGAGMHQTWSLKSCRRPRQPHPRVLMQE